MTYSPLVGNQGGDGYVAVLPKCYAKLRRDGGLPSVGGMYLDLSCQVTENTVVRT